MRDRSGDRQGLNGSAEDKLSGLPETSKYSEVMGHHCGPDVGLWSARAHAR